MDITNLTEAVIANHRYRIRGMVIYRSSATTVGALFGYNGPAQTRAAFRSQKQIVAGGTPGTDMFSDAVLSAVNTPLPNSTAEPAANTDLIWEIDGVYVPSASGTFALRMSKENVAGTISVMPGSMLEVYDLDA